MYLDRFGPAMKTLAARSFPVGTRARYLGGIPGTLRRSLVERNTCFLFSSGPAQTDPRFCVAYASWAAHAEGRTVPRHRPLSPPRLGQRAGEIKGEGRDRTRRFGRGAPSGNVAVGAIRTRVPPGSRTPPTLLDLGLQLEPAVLPVLPGLPFPTAAYNSSSPNHRSGTASRSCPRIHRADPPSHRPRTASFSGFRDPPGPSASGRRSTTTATSTIPPTPVRKPAPLRHPIKLIVNVFRPPQCVSFPPSSA